MSVDVGQEAPDFELRNQRREPVKLSDFRGRRNVVLVFYPLAFSGVCTGELCAIRDELDDFADADAEVLAVSVDSHHVLREYAAAQGYEFQLLSDFWPHGEVARTYGVFDDAAGIAVRGTFIIDRDGVVRWRVVNAVPDARNTGDYKAALAALA